MNTVRFQKGDGIYFTVYGFFNNKPDSISGFFCKAWDLPRKEGEAEDRFCERLYRRLERRHRWRSIFASIKRFFSVHPQT